MNDYKMTGAKSSLFVYTYHDQKVKKFLKKSNFHLFRLWFRLRSSPRLRCRPRLRSRPKPKPKSKPMPHPKPRPNPKPLA